ncbi:hypothetical protein EDD16DRAFT_1469976, partial [Pisolithus croceorrhizus]
ELLFHPSIPAITLNHKTLVIVVNTEIYICNISNVWFLHIIKTAPNPRGEHGTCIDLCDEFISYYSTIIMSFPRSNIMCSLRMQSSPLMCG